VRDANLPTGEAVRDAGLAVRALDASVEANGCGLLRLHFRPSGKSKPGGKL
jgi:hypothetical protein